MASVDELDLTTHCAEAVARLHELKINLLAIDFDLTMIDIHTGGVWKGSATELATHVRPFFKQFVTEAHNSNPNIKIAIVTFSPQVRHIHQVLRITFPDFYDCIPIRGRDKSWTYEGNGCREGKQSFIASAAAELSEHFKGEEFCKAGTLLIDDDANNIKVALGDGTRAIWLNPYKPNDLIENLRNLV